MSFADKRTAGTYSFVSFITKIMLLGLTLVSLQQLKHNTLPTQVLIPANICKSSRHVLKTSSTRRKCNGFLSSKTSSRHVVKTSSAILQRNNFSSSKTSCNTSLRHLEDIWQDVSQDVLQDEKLLHWWHLQDVLETSNMFSGDKCI